MKFSKEILKLYLIADACQPDLLAKTEEALKGGVTFVQLRMKDAESREFYDMALKMKKLCDAYEVPFVINDRIDIALAVDADGVHIGQGDIPLKIARKLLGADKIIGVTAKDRSEIQEAADDGADYIGSGALYSTQTKADCKTMPLAIFEELCKFSPIPIVGIGGITKERTLLVVNAGAAGVAVSSAILGAALPKEETQLFYK